MGFTVAKDGGGGSLAEAKQQALSFRRAARELDLTLREGLFLPTQLHFDIGTFGFRIRTTFLSPSDLDFLQSVGRVAQCGRCVGFLLPPIDHCTI